MDRHSGVVLWVTALESHWQVTASHWDEGVARLHWLLTFGDQPDVLRSATRAQAALESPPWLDPVPPRSLHLTLDDDPGAFDPFVLHFDRLELWPTGVMLVPSTPVVLGVERPHVTLAYVNDGRDVDARTVLPGFEPCAALVERAERVWMRRHGRTYAWDPAGT